MDQDGKWLKLRMLLCNVDYPEMAHDYATINCSSFYNNTKALRTN